MRTQAIRSSLPSRAALLVVLAAALVGCRSADPMLGIAPPAPVSAAASLHASETVGSVASAQPAFAPQVQFLPVIGAPEEKVVLLAQSLASSAAAHGVTVLPSTEANPPLRAKGYFSTFGEGAQKSVVYVWDVMDPAGQRVRRIQGQERIGASAGDPWAAVDAATLTAVADRTMADLARIRPAGG